MYECEYVKVHNYAFTLRPLVITLKTRNTPNNPDNPNMSKIPNNPTNPKTSTISNNDRRLSVQYKFYKTYYDKAGELLKRHRSTA